MGLLLVSIVGTPGLAFHFLRARPSTTGGSRPPSAVAKARRVHTPYQNGLQDLFRLCRTADK